MTLPLTTVKIPGPLSSFKISPAIYDPFSLREMSLKKKKKERVKKETKAQKRKKKSATKKSRKHVLRSTRLAEKLACYYQQMRSVRIKVTRKFYWSSVWWQFASDIWRWIRFITQREFTISSELYYKFLFSTLKCFLFIMIYSFIVKDIRFILHITDTVLCDQILCELANVYQIIVHWIPRTCSGNRNLLKNK